MGPDAFAAVLGGQRPGERLQTTLRRRVNGLTSERALGRHRADVDDDPGLLLEHDGEDGPRAEDRAEQIDVDHPAPGLLELADHRRRGRGVEDGDSEGPPFGAGGLNDLERRRDAGFVARVGERHRRPRGSQVTAEGAAEAARASRDQRGLFGRMHGLSHGHGAGVSSTGAVPTAIASPAAWRRKSRSSAAAWPAASGINWRA